MRTTPFDSPPYLKFNVRLLVQVIAWLLLSWGITGLLYPHFWLARPTQISAVSFDPDGWLQLYKDTAANLGQPPGVCSSGRELRDVEADLCRDFRFLLRQRVLLTFTPWGVLLVYLVLKLLIFQSYYQQAAAQVRRGKPKFVGRVLPNPLKRESRRVPGGVFEKFYFLSPIQVELANKSIIIAYLGRELAKVKQEQSVKVYEVKTLFTGKHYLGVLDYPHIAIIRGI